MDMTGQVIGRLTVVSRAGVTPAGAATWNCLCQCGKSCVAVGFKMRQGRTKSCGCWRLQFKVTHGMSHNGSNAPEYGVWSHIIQRCTNPKNKRFSSYGGRGIAVCPEWRESFAAFFAHVGARPTPKHTLDRFPDKNGNYEPGNVRWATAKEQASNTRRNRFVEWNGQSLTISQWAEKLGINRSLMGWRLSHWGIPKALATPAKRKR
jgi:hypothetical protein